MSASQLLKLASSIDDGSIIHNTDDLSEPELYDLIVDYIRSEKLGVLEDEGMAQLLLLDNMLRELLATDTGEVGASQATPLEMGDVMIHQKGCSTPPHPDRNHPDKHSFKPSTDIPTPPSNT